MLMLLQRSNKNKQKIEKLQTIDLHYFLVKNVLVTVFFKICLFINQYLL